MFPGLQGGPHNNNIAALCAAFEEAEGGDYRKYTRQICENAKMLGEIMVGKGYKLVSGGTDNHLFLWDVRGLGGEVHGGVVQDILEKVGIVVNKNSIIGDRSALKPGGVRIGLAAMTTRGLWGREDMERVADLLEKGVGLIGNGNKDEIELLRKEVEDFVGKLILP